MKAIAIALVSLCALPAAADWFGECGEKADRRVSAQVAGVSRVVIIGRSGSLRVDGQAGVTDVRATGTACASEASFLEKIQLVSRRNGNQLEIEAVIPDWSGFGFHSAGLDFKVVLPHDLPVVVRDGSGSARIEDLASVEVVDGSGSLEISRIAGDVDVRDGSGSISIRDIGGDVRLVDGSGSVDIGDVRGSVLIADDGSGGIDIRGVKRNVIIDDHGSGGVEVSDIGGDFTVKQRGSGGIDYERVAGRVSVPAKRR